MRAAEAACRPRGRLATVTACGLAGIALAGSLGGFGEAADLLNSFAPLTCAALALLVLLLAIRRACMPALPVALAGLALAGWPIAREYARPIPLATPPAATAPLRLLSLNVWVRNAHVAETLAAIRAARADVVLLQETNGRLGDALDALAPTYPYRTRCPARCGLRILSRRPLIASGYRLRAGGEPFGPPLIWATTTAPDGRGVTVVTLHYDWPLPGHHQARNRAALAAVLAGVDRTDMLLAGDMNLTPWSFAMRAQDAALAPMVRHTRGLWSWPARFPGNRRFPLPLLPIDQIYAGPAWRQVAIERLPRLGSDHYGVLATFAR